MKSVRIFSFILPAVLAATLLSVDAPETDLSAQAPAVYSGGSSTGEFITQTGDPGTRRRVRRRTRRRVKRRQEMKGSFGFALQSVSRHAEIPGDSFMWNGSFTV